MFHRLREPFGKAGLTVAIVALVAALAGGAYAANGGNPLASASSSNTKKEAPLNKKQKQEATNIAKKYAGKNGAQGPAGSNGAVGAQGSKGDAGQPGGRGEEGQAGKEGKEGSPWTAGGTLPSEATETGTWSFTSGKAEVWPGFNNNDVRVPISFPIPLETELSFNLDPTQSQIHLILKNGKEQNPETFAEIENPPDCPGNAANPTAEPGNLCLYLTGEQFSLSEVTAGVYVPSNGFKKAANPAELGASKAGLFVQIETKEKSIVSTGGTWAVTAP